MIASSVCRPRQVSQTRTTKTRDFCPTVNPASFTRPQNGIKSAIVIDAASACDIVAGLRRSSDGWMIVYSESAPTPDWM